MSNFELYDQFLNKRGRWLIYLIQGLLVVSIGVIILLVPEILIAFVATLFFIAGSSLIGLALHLRRRRQVFCKVKINLNE
jgi:sulfite exporter TauE/SafE